MNDKQVLSALLAAMMILISAGAGSSGTGGMGAEAWYATLVTTHTPSLLMLDSLLDDKPSPTTSSTTVTLTAVADATVKSWQPDSNFGSESVLTLSYSAIDEVREAVTLLRFDVASALPEGAIIDSASLELFLEDGAGADPAGVTAYFVTSSWAESSVIWNSFPTAEPIGVISQVDRSPDSYKSWQVTSFARVWQSGSNNGVYLRGPVDGTYYERTFESREHGESVPRLVVTYHLPSPAYTFAGNVYQGNPPETSTPVGDVTVELWGDEDEWPEAGFERVMLTSTATGDAGTFSLSWEDEEFHYPYLHIIEIDPPGAYSTGAQAGEPGYVKNSNVVSYPDIPPGTYDGIAFWDQLPEELPDLVITDAWNEEGRICYQIRNIGDGVAPGGHYTALIVDDEYSVSDPVEQELEPGERLQRCFDYDWECTSPEDIVVVVADHEEGVAEDNKTNNQREEVWKCDVISPQIVYGPIVQEVTRNLAVIFWETDDDSDSVVRYGKTARLYDREEGDSTMVIEHSVTLSGLEPSATYNFVAQSTDPGGNTVVSDDIIFETLPLPDAENPTVSIIDPIECQGVVTIEAEASDNTGVAKVEFYLDGELVFTDYSPPYELTLDTDKYENGEYVLEARACDIAGRYVIDSLEVDFDNLKDITAPQVTILEPSPDKVAVPAGKVIVKAELKDDAGLAHAHLIVDGKNTWEDYANFASHPKQTTVTLEWDATQAPQGLHTLAVEVCDIDTPTAKWGSATRQVNLVSAVPPPTPPHLKVTHEIKRYDNYFAITLVVENDGQQAAENVEIQDFLRGFQPISSVETTPVNATYEANYDAYKREWECKITSNEDIPKMSSRNYIYFAVPTLCDSNQPAPNAGYLTGVHYDKDAKGLKIHDWFGASKPKDAWSGGQWKPIADAYEEALNETNYLIVTNPIKLFAFGPTQTNAVNSLLSDMAELARYKKGTLGYVHKHDKDHLRELIKPKGAWAKKLHPEFSEVLKGYLLIVGETEIVPTYYTSGWDFEWSDGTTTNAVWNTDELYASTTGSSYGGWDPELVVGRIVGNDPADLANAIRTSIDECTGSLDFDYSHALVVSGTGNGQDKMVGTADALQKSLNGNMPKVDTTKIHWKDYTTEAKREDAFYNAAGNKDLIYIYDHGLPDRIGALGTGDIRSKTDFKGTAPVIFGTSCLTGCYENHRNPSWQAADDSIPEAFLDEGAGVYIGSTELSAMSTNTALGKVLFPKMVKSTQSRTLPVGWHLADMKRSYWNYGKKYRFWACEYNLYGDPKFGTTAAPTTTTLSSSAKSVLLAEPAEAVQVTIPDYQVSTIGNADYVEIPGGAFLLEDGQPQVPCYAVELDYPTGCQVQEVVLDEKGGELSDTGMNLPIVAEEIAAPEGTDDAATGDGQGWYPSQDYRWHSQRKPDGSTTLVLVVYPFIYNPRTTNVKFYKDYSFAVDYVVTGVSIASLSTDAREYEQGELVTLDLELANSGETQDVVVSVVVKEHGGLGENVDGLLLEMLKEFSGQASFSPQWDSGGFQPGYYAVEATLKDINSNVLDRKTEMFRLGISSGKIASFTATPECFDIGDEIEIEMEFENTGTVNITGTAVIRVLNSTGYATEEFSHNVTNLTPSGSVSFSDAWDTSGAEEGSSYAIIGYVLYDGKSTDPATVTVQNMIMGDLNRDGVVTAADAAIALELAARGEWDPTADVDCDGRVTSLDALMILQAASGAIEL